MGEDVIVEEAHQGLAGRLSGPSDLLHRAGRLAHHQGGGQFDAPLLDRGGDMAYGGRPDLVERLADGRQLGGDPLAEVDVVEAHH